MTRAVILAAGRGSRMGDLTDEQPKCFTEVGGRRLLDWQLDALRGAGIDRIAIVRGYRGEAFTENVEYFDNPRWAQTNMVYSLARAAQWLEDEDCIVSYSDIFYDRRTVSALRESDGELGISFDPDWLRLWQRRFADPLSDAETFRRHPDGTLAEIGSRPATVAEVEGQFMGLLHFRPAGWARVERLRVELDEASDRLDTTGLLRLGLQRGWTIDTVPVLGAWGEVDSPTDLTSYSDLSRS